jgi:hypothetical protein
MSGLKNLNQAPRKLGGAGVSGGGGTGPLQRTEKTLTFADSPYTVETGDYAFLVDCTGGVVQIDLPTAIGNTRELQIMKIDASVNAVNIDAFGTETINGALTNTDLDVQGEAYTIRADGANYRIWGSY